MASRIERRAPAVNSPWALRWRAGVVFLVLGVVASFFLTPYFGFLGSTGAINALMVLSVGLAFNRSGMLYLCPAAFAAVGAWVGGWGAVDLDLPFLVCLLMAAVFAVPVGGLIGLLALRIRGMTLAIATLALNSVVQVLLSVWPIPGTTDNRAVPRPSFLQSQDEYFLFCLLCLAAIGAVVTVLVHGRIGAGWMMLKSERAAAGSGANVLRTKVGLFVVCAVIAVIGGFLMIGQTGSVDATSFSNSQSLLFVVVAILLGAGRMEGAVVGGVASVALPELFLRLKIPTEVSTILFGLGALQVLAKGGEGVAAQQQARRAERRTRRSLAGAGNAGSGAEPGKAVGRVGWNGDPPDLLHLARAVAQPNSPGPGQDEAVTPVLEIRALSVRYGAIRAVDSVDLVVPRGRVVGLVGPNGAGKTTLIDAATGFVASMSGDVVLDGRSLRGSGPHLRARAGLRRTFQQSRLVDDLTIEQYVCFVSRAGIARADIDEVLGVFGCPSRDRSIGTLDVPTRRLVELAASVAAKPKVLMLDEPGAGLGEEETLTLAEGIKRLPQWFGISVLLVEHDMVLVQHACSALTVLESGRVLATGAPEQVLGQEDVRVAYLGPQSVAP